MASLSQSIRRIGIRRAPASPPAREEMVRQQRMLAAFGEFALRSEDREAVLQEACRLVAEAVGVTRAKVLEIELATDTAVVRAGVGWRDGVVGQVRIPLAERSSEAHALRACEPVVVRDIAAETRFGIPQFMAEAGVVAFVNVPIFLPGGVAFGLLQVDADEPRTFGGETVEFLRTYATILGPVIDRLDKNRRLALADMRAEVLLRELRHRMSNDLAVIQSLIRVRARGASADVAAELAILQERLEALRLLHSHLHGEGQDERIALGPYVESLLANLLHLRADQAANVRIETASISVQVSRDVAGPLGLILNEFATNSFKYAFPDRGGTVRVEVVPINSGRALLRLSDDGVGLSGSCIAASGSRSGMGLIAALAEQIGGAATWSSSGPGLCLETQFTTC